MSRRRADPEGAPRRRPTAVGEALASYLAQAGLAEGVARAAVVAEWPALVGEQIAAVTTAESVTPDGVLRVHVRTAAWANELQLMTPQIIARINAGRRGRISGIRWIAGGSRQRP